MHLLRTICAERLNSLGLHISNVLKKIKKPHYVQSKDRKEDKKRKKILNGN